MTQQQISTLVTELVAYVTTNQEALSRLNESITNDTDHWIAHDYSFALNYLETYLSEHAVQLGARRKPCGDVLIILSYNEPFVLSLIPILNALVARNRVHVRPSSKAQQFFAKIWFESGIVDRLNLSLQLEARELAVVYEELGQFESVYFFGSHQHAAELAAACGKHYVSFHPEIEGVDTKVLLPEQSTEWSIENDARDTLRQSMSHAGQSCQRIHGVFVPQTFKGEYVAALQAALEDEALLRQHVRENHTVSDAQQAYLEDLIEKAQPQAVHRAVKKLAVVIDAPEPASELVLAAFFMPTLWVIGYSDLDEVLEQLNARRYRLGLNIVGDSEGAIAAFIEKTRFSRYTVNTSHIEIRPGEGWGGLSPTGFHGYQNWIEHFSYPINVIR